MAIAREDTATKTAEKMKLDLRINDLRWKWRRWHVAAGGGPMLVVKYFVAIG